MCIYIFIYLLQDFSIGMGKPAFSWHFFCLGTLRPFYGRFCSRTSINFTSGGSSNESKALTSCSCCYEGVWYHELQVKFGDCPHFFFSFFLFFFFCLTFIFCPQSHYSNWSKRSYYQRRCIEGFKWSVVIRSTDTLYFYFISHLLCLIPSRQKCTNSRE
jgi:hypothetical protein